MTGLKYKSQNTSLDASPSLLIASTSGGYVPTTMKKHMTETQQNQKQPILFPGIEMTSNPPKKN